MHLRIRCDSNKMGKYGKQKSLKEIKVDEHSERRCRSKPCATDEKILRKGKLKAKPIVNKKKNGLK